MGEAKVDKEFKSNSSRVSLVATQLCPSACRPNILGSVNQFSRLIDPKSIKKRKKTQCSCARGAISF